jgi:hypothetical protein
MTNDDPNPTFCITVNACFPTFLGLRQDPARVQLLVMSNAKQKIAQSHPFASSGCDNATTLPPSKCWEKERGLEGGTSRHR